MYLIVAGLIVYYEPTVLSIVPAAINCLQVKSQLVAAVTCQLMQQVVAEPVVASRILETNFELLPRTVKGVGPVEVLLDQQRNTAGYITNNQIE